MALDSLIAQTVSLALQEDIGSGDVSAALIDPTQMAKARIETREATVLCGTSWADAVFHELDAHCTLDWRAHDGEHVKANQVLCHLQGKAQALLSAERTALNFLQLLSGIASKTAQLVALIAHTKTKILDTRKTLPCLRVAQKEAVRCGGGVNHRMGLYDAYLIKENHIRACGSVQQAVALARQANSDRFLEVEVETIAQLQECLTIPHIDRILLDNFSLDAIQEAIVITKGRVPLEASGGITPESLRTVAEMGIDYVSLGALTKDVRAADMSILFE